MLAVNCPTCSGSRTIFFDHTRGTVTASCSKCGPATGPPTREAAS